MSVINYTERKEALELMHWAVYMGLFAATGVTLGADTETVEALRELGFEPEVTETPFFDEYTLYFSLRNDAEAAALIAAANAASFAVRYGEKVDLEAAVEAAKGIREPLEELNRARARCPELNPNYRVAWSILSRFEYNILPEARFGKLARELIRWLKAALAYEVMKEEVPL